MLIPAILSVLGASVLSDAKPEPRLYHTVFTWDNGGEIRRILDVCKYLDEFGMLIEGDEVDYYYIDYCIGNRHTILCIHPYKQRSYRRLGTKSYNYGKGKIRVELFYSPSQDHEVDPSLPDEIAQEEEGARICWLILFYLDAWFYRDYQTFHFHNIGFPKLRITASLNEIEDHLKYVRDTSSVQEPDGIDPYELTVYQTGQMQHSFFFMSTMDCLKVLGC